MRLFALVISSLLCASAASASDVCSVETKNAPTVSDGVVAIRGVLTKNLIAWDVAGTKTPEAREETLYYRQTLGLALSVPSGLKSNNVSTNNGCPFTKVTLSLTPEQFDLLMPRMGQEVEVTGIMRDWQSSVDGVGNGVLRASVCRPTQLGTSSCVAYPIR